MSVKPKPDGYHTVTPYLMVDNCEQQIEFLEKAFDGKLKEKLEDDKGIRHAEVQVGDSVIMMGRAGEPMGALPCMLYLYVPDVDETYQKALSAGATVVMEPNDAFYGDRSGGVQGPCGNHWWVATHIEDVDQEELQRRAAEQAKQQ